MKTTPFDFEAMMVEGLVYHYARRLADAYLLEDYEEALRIADYIRANYGQAAALHVGELAVELAVQR